MNTTKKEDLHLEEVQVKINSTSLITVELITLGTASYQEAKEDEIENTKKSAKYKRREFNFATFKKSFHINNDIDLTKINAKYEDGILSVSLEKREEAKAQEPRRITVA